MEIKHGIIKPTNLNNLFHNLAMAKPASKIHNRAPGQAVEAMRITLHTLVQGTWIKLDQRHSRMFIQKALKNKDWRN